MVLMQETKVGSNATTTSIAGYHIYAHVYQDLSAAYSSYLRPLPLPLPAEPRGFEQSDCTCPFWPHLKHSTLLILFCLDAPDSDSRPCKLMSSSAAVGGRADDFCVGRDWLFLSANSRFVSRMSSAVGSSLSYSSEDDSASPSDPSAFSNVTGFYTASVTSQVNTSTIRTSFLLTPPPYCFRMGRTSSSSSSDSSAASISAYPACRTCNDSGRLPASGSM